MTINDLLAPNETVQLSGTVTYYLVSVDIYLTNQCLYLYCEKGYVWNVFRYDCITSLQMQFSYGGEWEITFSIFGFYTTFKIGNNRQWADSIFKCIKRGWDDAKRHTSTGTTGGDGNPFFGW